MWCSSLIDNLQYTPFWWNFRKPPQKNKIIISLSTPWFMNMQYYCLVCSRNEFLFYSMIIYLKDESFKNNDDNKVNLLSFQWWTLYQSNFESSRNEHENKTKQKNTAANDIKDNVLIEKRSHNIDSSTFRNC